MNPMSLCGLFLTIWVFNAVKSNKIISRIETNFVMLRRDFEWTVESTPEMNLTQYLIEKGHIESPLFHLQDSGRSQFVLKLSHLPDTKDVARYFSLRSGGPLKMVYHRLSLVNQFLTSKDLLTNGYTKTLEVGDSLGLSFWSFQNLTSTTLGYNKKGAIIFKLELLFLDRIAQTNEQKFTQKQTSKLTNISNGKAVSGIGTPSSSEVTEFSTSDLVFEWRMKAGPGFNLEQHGKENNERLNSSLLDLGDSNHTNLVMGWFECMNYFSFMVISGGPLRNVTYRLSVVNQLLRTEDNSKSESGAILTKDRKYGERQFSISNLVNPQYGFLANGELLFKLEISFFHGIKNSGQRGTTTRH